MGSTLVLVTLKGTDPDRNGQRSAVHVLLFVLAARLGLAAQVLVVALGVLPRALVAQLVALVAPVVAFGDRLAGGPCGSACDPHRPA
eukprot:1425181-Pyramimonas_sp.AAC.1